MEPNAWVAGTAVGALTLLDWIPVNYSGSSKRTPSVEDMTSPKPNVRGDFYAAIRSVTWSPPRIVYGPVWFALYILMSIAMGYWWLSSVATLDINRHRAIWIVYFVSLFFNKIWSFLFFGMRSSQGLVFAAVDAFLILATAIAEVVLFHVDNAPTITLVLWYIYIAWLAFAFGLSTSIAANRKKIFQIYKE